MMGLRKLIRKLFHRLYYARESPILEDLYARAEPMYVMKSSKYSKNGWPAPAGLKFEGVGGQRRSWALSVGILVDK